MDLGIKGKRALVCASSKGLGLGCAEALADHYVVMERGEVIASGPGSEMQVKNVRHMVAI